MSREDRGKPGVTLSSQVVYLMEKLSSLPDQVLASVAADLRNALESIPSPVVMDSQDALTARKVERLVEMIDRELKGRRKASYGG